MGKNSSRGYLHVLYSPKAEGCPRLALDLIKQERQQTGREGSVAFCTMNPGTLLPAFGEQGTAVHRLNWRRREFIRLFVSALQIFRKIRPVGVIIYTIGMHVPVAVAARLCSIPTVVHIGNPPPFGNDLTMTKLRTQMLAGALFVNRHIACSEYVARACKSAYGLPDRLVSVAHNGIHLKSFLDLRQEKTDSRKAKALRIGMVASLEHHKDHSLLIEAFAILIGRGQRATLHIVGDGSLKNALQARARELKVDRHVSWTGAVTDVKTELKNLDVFAFAVKDDEGLGIALVEALAAGLPVVASDVGACREVLDGGRWGRLVSVRDPAVWADALVTAGDLPVALPSDLARYDIRKTFVAYNSLLGVVQ